MHVHPDHVPHPALEEDPVRPGGHALCGVAFHQAERFQVIEQAAAGQQVDITEFHSAFDRLQAFLQGGIDRQVDLPLAWAEFAPYRDGAGDVAAVKIGILRPGVIQRQLTCLHLIAVEMIVQGLSAHRKDHRVSHPPAVGQRNAFHPARHLALVDPRAGHLHGGDVHLAGDLQGVLDFGQLQVGFHRALRGHRHNQRFGNVIIDPPRMEAEQRLQAKQVLRPVLRQEVNPAFLVQGVLQRISQLLCRYSVRDPAGLPTLADGRLRPHPDDLVDGVIVAEERFLIRVDIDQRRQPGKIQPEIIQERAVLAVVVTIITIVHRALVIAEKKDHPRSDLLL